MPRRFNTAGPCKADLHYIVPPLSRIGPMRELIDNQSYFVLHAPRQAGKTTLMMEFARVLTGEGKYAAALVAMSAGSMFQDIGAGERAILDAWQDALALDLPVELTPS